jgi:hypothetical protein
MAIVRGLWLFSSVSTTQVQIFFAVFLKLPLCMVQFLVNEKAHFGRFGFRFLWIA